MKKLRNLATWQTRTLVALIVGYGLYYFLRKNLSAALPAMEATLGISKATLGLFLSLNGVVYGVSRLVNGVIADHGDKRKLLTAGLIFSAIINLVICFSPKMNGVINLLDTEGKATAALIYLVGGLWVVNGYVHGLGCPSCVGILAAWFKSEELATKQSIWNASHSIGAGIVIALCGFILSRFGYSAWNLCFIIPAAISVIGAIAIWPLFRNSPEDLGLSLEGNDSDAMANEQTGTYNNALNGQADEKTATAESASQNEPELKGEAFRKFIREMVLRNPLVWIVAIADFCVYVVRFTVLEWGTSFLTQYRGLDIQLSANIVAISELVGGVLGALVAGWVSDKFMKSLSIRTCVVCMVLSTVSLLAFWKLPVGAHWMYSAIFIVLTSFFIYGPQALLGVCASQYATRHASATASGIVGIFSYAATMISGWGFGMIADRPELGWDAVFAISVIFGVVGTAIMLLAWKAPANCYDKAEKVLSDLQTKS